MELKTLDINLIEPLYGKHLKKPDLVELLKSGDIKQLPPIPVIEIPEQLRKNGEIYSSCDGHKRYNAALQNSISSLDCLVYDSNDDLREVAELSGNARLMRYRTHVKVLEKGLFEWARY